MKLLHCIINPVRFISTARQRQDKTKEVGTMASFAQLNKMAADLPLGKYVVMGQDGEPRFFEIADIKGAHRAYRLTGAPGDYHRHTMNIKWQTYVLTTITSDVKKAFTLYGKFARHCGACDSALTHARSRACGMGPKCAPKHGIKW